MSHATHNFAAGPGALPKAVRSRAQEGLRQLPDKPYGILDLDSRSDEFEELVAATKHNIACLLELAKDQHVLLLPGGASLQFAMVPLNLKTGTSARYYVAGTWGKRAYEEAERVYQSKPYEISLRDDCEHPYFDICRGVTPDYLHFTSNETIEGKQFAPEEIEKVPAVCDMTSNLLIRPIDASKLGLIYASAHRNAGVAGLTIVIISTNLLERSSKQQYLPESLSYWTYFQGRPYVTTPPIYAIYLAYLTTNWILEQGGLPVMARRNAEKAAALYATLDHSDGFYIPRVSKDVTCRSTVNVVWNLKNKDQDQHFLAEAERRGIYGLENDPAVGGIRASLYNGVPKESVDYLIEFMDDFRYKCQAC